MSICLPYDMEKIYPFFCSRYGNITYNELLNMGYEEFSMKLSSIPESEPLYKIIQSRVINLNEIKDKEERRYWRKLKSVNAIPDIYRSNKDIYRELASKVNSNKEVIK